MTRIRVLIADDHAVLRAGLRMLINSQPDMEVVGEASDGREALQVALSLKPDVVVMDITMPAGGGVQAIEAVRSQLPATRVLVLSMHHDPAYVRAALAAGAAGYVAKRAADTELLSGIRAVHLGQTFVDPTLAGTVLQEIFVPPRDEPQRASLLDRLSPRERQVLELLIQGYTNQQIADRLCFSVKTAETHRARLMRKLGLRDRADLIRYGLESGLLTPGRAIPDAGGQS